MSSGQGFQELLRTIAKLRSPNGCPWDKKQTHQSLKPYVIEEAYEVIAAIDKRDPELLKEELGDLLLQIVLQAQIAQEKKEFTMQDVVEILQAKMIRRHPHVFGQKKLKSVKAILREWEKIKKIEKNGQKGSFFAGIPAKLPALYRAEKIQKKAARVGFDWEKVEGAWDKVQEELKEFYRAYRSKKRRKAQLQEELGDVLFSLVNVARKLHIDAEDALRSTIAKFVGRFDHLEKRVHEQNRELADCSLQELDAMWEESKAKVKGQKSKIKFKS